MSDADPPTLVLVHGAWHGSWCWDELLPHLEQRGLSAVTVDLPSSGPDPASLGGLDDDVAAVTAALDATPGRTVLVGHSYGGLPVSAASADRDDVDRLVYVCAFVLEVGQSLLDAAGGQPPAFWNIADDRASMTADDPVAVFYPDVEPQLARASAARLGHQSLPACTAPLPAAGCTRLPSTYVVADADTGIPPSVQEAMAAGKVTDVRHLPSAHSPFLSHPEQLADLLAEAVRTPA